MRLCRFGAEKDVELTQARAPTLCNTNKVVPPYSAFYAGTYTTEGCRIVPEAVPAAAEDTAGAAPPAPTGGDQNGAGSAGPRGPPPPTDPSLPRASGCGFRQGASRGSCWDM